MTTIKPGKTTKERPDTDIWVGTEFTCFNCRGVFKLEKSDVVLQISPSTRRVLSIETPRCPTPGCHLINVVDVPLKKAAPGT
jgi:hypothetical protein